MAVFNPEQRDINTSPDFSSKPIAEPEVDKSKALAWKGMGDVLEEGAKSVDELFKKHAEFVGEQAGEQEQSDYLKGVQTVYSLTQNKPALPSGLEQGMQGISNLAEAQRQGTLPGHVRETAYLGNLYMRAKDLRSAYPGYRDYIDKGIEKATGITPNANTYIKSMLADINESLTKSKAEHEKVTTRLSKANDEGMPGADHISQAWDKGQISKEDVDTFLNRANFFKWQGAVREDRYKQFEQDQKYQSTYAADDISATASQATNAAISGLFVNLGMKDEKLADLMDKAAKGEAQVSDQQWGYMRQLVDMEERKLRSSLDAKFAEPVDIGNGQTRTRRQMAGKEYEEHLKSGMKQLDMIKQAIDTKDTGLMYTAKTAGEAMIHGAMFKTLQDPNVGPYMLMMGVANKAGGPNVPQFINDMIRPQGSKGFFPNKESVDALTANIMSGQKYHGIDNMSKTIDTVTTNTNNPKTLDAIATAPQKIIVAPQITDEAKVNAANHTFDPKQGWLDKIEVGGTSLEGKPLRGRYEVYTEYSQPKMVHEMKRLSEQYGSKIFDNYKDWMETSFSKSLFSREIGTLKDIQTDAIPGLSVRFTDDGVNPPRFSVDRGDLRDINLRETKNLPVLERLQVEAMNKSINNLNTGMKGLFNVYQGSGDNPRAKLLSFFQELGVDSSKMRGSVPYNMLMAVGSTMKPPKEKKDASGNQ